MRFFIISDLHLSNGVSLDDAKEQLTCLCSKIRIDFSPKETILFIVLGDIINASDITAFSEARICLDYICEELKGRDVKFEFVPGNHDLPSGDINYFNQFISNYGSYCSFNKSNAYSRVYDNVNFIFADSNLSRDHRLPGKLDIDAIHAEVKDTLNVLFCHHGFTHSYGGDHDTIEHGENVLEELKNINIKFAFHGHTHRADATMTQSGIVEIGCGTLFKDITDMPGIQNQFSVGYINEGKIVRIERLIMSKDGSNLFPSEIIYPEQQKFADPSDIGKCKYDAVPDYIQRKVIPHTFSIGKDYEWFFSQEKKISLYEALMKSEKVLFLSDAGQGKSIEMENLAYVLTKTSYFPFLYKLRNYTNLPIENLLPSRYNELAPHNIVLLFDGYDELSAESRRNFENHLNSYVQNNPGVQIVISSRSNFCKTEKHNESKTFPGFQIYDLCKLNKDDIDNYLRSQGIDTKRFFSEARISGVFDLLTNAFYLTEISSLFNKIGKLPTKSDLMDTLIEVRFDIDDIKFANELENNYVKFMDLLKRLSFAMQLTQKSSLNDRTEYQKLFNDSERNLIKHSGLLIKEGDTWQFIHNNFREYLTAKYLSDMDEKVVLSYISSGDGIKPSWVNTLGYLTAIELQWDITEWIAENAPNALVKFEPDRITPETRFKAFKQLFNYYEEKNLWLRDELCDEEELAHFSESYTAIVFLLDKISNPVHSMSQYAAINILRHYKKLYGKNKEILNCLLNCCRDFPKTNADVCRLAIYAISQLELHSPEVTNELIALFKHSDNDYVRLGMYEYLLAIGMHNDYVDFFVDGIQYIINYNNNRIGNESFILVKGLKSMSTSESIYRIMNWYASKDNIHFHNDEEVFTLLSRKAIDLYKEGAHDLYDIILKCCIKSLLEYEHKSKKDCVSFFVETDTIEVATLHLVEFFEKDLSHFSDFLYTYPDAFNYIFKAYSEEKFNIHEAFKDIVMRHVDEDSLYENCSNILLKRSGNQLPKREPKINYESVRRKGVIEYFNALFCKEKAERMLEELINAIGEPDLLVKDLLKSHSKIPWYSPLRNLQFTIYHHAEKDSKAEDFFTDIDFEYFTIAECHKMLEGKKEITVSNEQINIIKEIITRWLNYDLLTNGIKFKGKNITVNSFIHSSIFLSQYFDLDFEEEKMLDMTLVPEFCFRESSTKSKYEYLSKHVNGEKLKKRIEQNLDIDNFPDILLQDHIKFCSSINCDIATAKSLLLCNDDNADSWTRLSALEYLYKLYGADYISNEILPNATGDFLLDIITKCGDIPQCKLCDKLEREYTANPSNRLLSHLISIGSKIGLQAYVEEITKTLSLPKRKGDPYETTRMIGNIRNPALLPLLGKLIDVIFNPKFVDDEYFGLRGSLSNALINCGKSSPDKTIALIEECKSRNDDTISNTRFCNYAIEEIKRNLRKSNDTPMNIKDVLTLFKQCHI